MRDAIFTDWTDRTTAAFGNEPLKLAHNLHQHPLLQLPALARLIERLPREHYALVHMGGQREKRLWREGELASMPGEQVIEAIRAGRMWLNIRAINTWDAGFGELVRKLFREIAERVPGFSSFNESCGVLISSPGAQVYYHADLPGQSLWQISGRKRVYVYPNTPPFLTPEHLENIALYAVEIDMPYSADYDRHAQVHEIGPGEMLHWPLNAPHRIENLDVLNISLTTEFWTDDIRRRHIINVANGILRHKLGMAPTSRATSGLGFLAKAVLQSGARRAGWLDRARKSKRPIDFRLDAAHPGQIVDLPKRAA